jgi:hypothetical protein
MPMPIDQRLSANSEPPASSSNANSFIFMSHVLLNPESLTASRLPRTNRLRVRVQPRSVLAGMHHHRWISASPAAGFADNCRSQYVNLTGRMANSVAKPQWHFGDSAVFVRVVGITGQS